MIFVEVTSGGTQCFINVQRIIAFGQDPESEGTFVVIDGNDSPLEIDQTVEEFIVRLEKGLAGLTQ